MSNDPGNPIKNETGEYIGPVSNSGEKSEIKVEITAKDQATESTPKATPAKTVRRK